MCYICIVEKRRKIRHGYADRARFNAHGEFVAKMAGGRLAHARNAKMLAEVSAFFHIKIVERYNAIDFFAAHQPGQPGSGVLHIPLIFSVLLYIKYIVQRIARPGFVLVFFGGNEVNCRAGGFHAAQKFVALEITGDA